MIFGCAAVKDANGNVTGYTVKAYGYYTYDPWGKVTVKTAAGGTPSTNSLINRNPIRYRGYAYDNETGFYYLQSCYYDPANHRFINADAPEYSTMSAYGLNNSNLFVYCQNNPIVYGDENGEWLHFLIGAVVGAVTGVLSQVVSDVVTSVITGEVHVSSWQTYAGAAVDGAAGGVTLAATGNATLADAVSGAVTTGTTGALEKVTGKTEKSWAEVGVDALADGFASCALGDVVKWKV